MLKNGTLQLETQLAKQHTTTNAPLLPVSKRRLPNNIYVTPKLSSWAYPSMLRSTRVARYLFFCLCIGCMCVGMCGSWCMGIEARGGSHVFFNWSLPYSPEVVSHWVWSCLFSWQTWWPASSRDPPVQLLTPGLGSITFLNYPPLFLHMNVLIEKQRQLERQYWNNN